jgi:hypothetical protein
MVARIGAGANPLYFADPDMTMPRRLRIWSLGALLALVALGGTPAFAAAKFKVAAVGASTTLGSGSTAGHHFPDELGKLLGPDYDVKNFGVSAAGVLRKAKVSYWSTKEFTAAKALLPDVVVFWLGGSDTKPENWVYEAQFLTDMVDMIREFQNLPSHPKVVVMLSVAYKDADGVSKMLVEGQVQPRQRMAAAMTGCLLVDLQAAVAGHGEFFPDGIHPNDLATLAIAKAAYPVVLEAQKAGGGAGDGGAGAGGPQADAGGTGGVAGSSGSAGAGGGPGVDAGSAGAGGTGSTGGAGSASGGALGTGGEAASGGASGGRSGSGGAGGGSAGSAGGTSGGVAGSAGAGSSGCNVRTGAGRRGRPAEMGSTAIFLAALLIGRRRRQR